MATRKKLFLSAVSNEFVAYATLLAGYLKRPNLDVAVQSDFIVGGQSTLEKLDEYIRQCDAVIHLIGKATGSIPPEPAVAALLTKYPDLGKRLPPLADPLEQPQPGFSYTQWEAYLAIYHRRPLYVYRPTDFELDALQVPRDPRFVLEQSEIASQKAHYGRIAALGQDRGQFMNEERLSSSVLRDLVDILPSLESTIDVRPTRLRHTAERLIGRDDDLTRLDSLWDDPRKNVVVIRAWGGVGKTSLVATWMAELALKNWRGAERVYDWSFYSQGTREQGAASADTFIADALRTFGDPDPTAGSPWDRGARLAQFVAAKRCLLVLDGLEPLQHPPGPLEGKLKDQGIEALLKGLAAKNEGLCVVTTREKVDDIKQYYTRTAEDIELTFLTPLAGAALLHYSGATHAGAKSIEPDDKELQKASRELRGHGLTLHLVGQYLKLAEGGDIRKRDTMRLQEADKEYQNDATRPYGHAFKAMEAYERWFESEGTHGLRQLTVLELLGLFDRPASQGCLNALRAMPAIEGLTGAVVGLSTKEWNVALTRLQDINLLAVQQDGSVDAHPLLREYFARRIRGQQPEAWRAAHARVFEYLVTTTKDKQQPTVEDLQPLYQAVAHGCQANMHQRAFNDVYYARIERRDEAYASKKLGLMGSNLAAATCFFDTPWSDVSPLLEEPDQGWLLNDAAYYLRALGRLRDALQPMRKSASVEVTGKRWKRAAVSHSNLSQLELMLGDLPQAIDDAAAAVAYADRGPIGLQQVFYRTTHGDALHQAGRAEQAGRLFREAEALQVKVEPHSPRLYTLAGAFYCDLLLANAERAAWRYLIGAIRRGDGEYPVSALVPADVYTATANVLSDVSERATNALHIAERDRWIEDIPLAYLILSRAAVYEGILQDDQVGNAGTPDHRQSVDKALKHVNGAIEAFRAAGREGSIPAALLMRAFISCVIALEQGRGAIPGGGIRPLTTASRDLDEAWDIGERGPMPLLLADVHLHRARLFFRETPYPWNTNSDGSRRGPKDDLGEARRLIETHGYWRRKEELEDAEAVILDDVASS